MKKKLLALCLAAGIVLSVNAQEKTKISDKDLPATIQTNFKSQYPDASGADWKLKDGKYKVHFNVNGTKQMAAYDQAGTMLSKGVEIKQSELPANITSSTKSLYANRDIDEVYKVDKNGATQYLVKLKGDPETKILYSADGQVIKEKQD
jgi:Protein of unknown function (DUF2874).